MTDLVINIGIGQTIGLIVTFSGTLITLAWLGSARFTKIETLLEAFNARMTTMEGKSAGAFKTQSPISLQPKGEQMLLESGLKNYIDTSKNSLIEKCKEINSLQTAYDVQTAAFEYFDKAVFESEFENKLKQTAFAEGVTIDVLRRIGGIYFRDICLKQFNLDAKDLDK